MNLKRKLIIVFFALGLGWGSVQTQRAQAYSCGGQITCIQQENGNEYLVACSGTSSSCGNNIGNCNTSCALGDNQSGSNNCDTTCSGLPTSTGIKDGGGPSDSQAQGSFDAVFPADCLVGGWACDGDYYTAELAIHVYISSTFITSGIAGNYRSDLGPVCGGTFDHSFGIYLPPSYKDAVSRSYNVYAIGVTENNNTSGNNPLLSGSPKSMACSLCPAPGSFTVTKQCNGGTLTGILADWAAVPGGCGVDDYPVQRCTGSGCSSPTFLGTAEVPNTAYTDTTTSEGSTYGYRVRGHDDATGLYTYYTSILYITPNCVAPTATPTPAISCSISFSPSSGTAPLATTGTCTVSGGSGITDYRWDSYSDGTYEQSSLDQTSTSHAFSVAGYNAGTHTAKCEVTRNGIVKTCTKAITVTAPTPTKTPTPTPTPCPAPGSFTLTKQCNGGTLTWERLDCAA